MKSIKIAEIVEGLVIGLDLNDRQTEDKYVNIIHVHYSPYVFFDYYGDSKCKNFKRTEALVDQEVVGVLPFRKPILQVMDSIMEKESLRRSMNKNCH